MQTRTKNGGLDKNEDRISIETPIIFY